MVSELAIAHDHIRMIFRFDVMNLMSILAYGGCCAEGASYLTVISRRCFYQLVCGWFEIHVLSILCHYGLGIQTQLRILVLGVVCL